ncbi:MAG: type III pantothenate kinase [Clostridia bacterium]
MLLVIDVGNSNITFGVWKDDNLIGPWRLKTRPLQTSDQYGLFITEILNRNDLEDIIGVIISSVVPDVMHSFVNSIRKYLFIDPLIVGPGIKTGISIRTENPKEVGADRIVNSVAASILYDLPAIVIDFGTATSFDIINENSEFIGAVTAPGMQVSANAMYESAAQLPNVQIATPNSVVAKSTTQSMQAGIVFGQVGSVEYIVKKICDELDWSKVKIIATGGLGRLIAQESGLINVYDANLTLRGLKLIYYKNV